jgi:hypothetical protein
MILNACGGQLPSFATVAAGAPGARSFKLTPNPYDSI